MHKITSISTLVDFNFKESLRFLQRSDLEYLLRVEHAMIQFALDVEDEIFIS
jgi:hypothetical protein